MTNDPPGQAAARVNHLDWLRVLALLGVFLYHTLRAFDTDYWHVKNDEQSELLTEVLVAIGSWGLPFFFLVAGAGTSLALRWRTGGAFVRERLLRLAVPLAVGWLLLGPPQLWLGALGDRRGGLLLLFVPIAVMTVPLGSRIFTEEHGWGTWAFFFGFFLLGYVVTASPRLVTAVGRDIGPALALGVGGVVAVFALDAPDFFASWDGRTWSWRPVVLLVLIVAQAWGWVLAAWGSGMRVAAFRRPLPRAVGDAAMPFFVLHQPVVLAVAYVAVGLGLGIPLTWLLIVGPAFVVTAVLSWALSRLPGVRRLLGVKARPAAPSAVAVPGRAGAVSRDVTRHDTT